MAISRSWYRPLKSLDKSIKSAPWRPPLSDANFLSSPINIVMYCILFKNQINFLTILFQSKLRLGIRYMFQISLMYSQECLLGSSWILCFLNLFCVLKLHWYCVNLIKYWQCYAFVGVKGKKNCKYVTAVLDNFSSNIRIAFFTSKPFIYLVISSRDTCLKLNALSLWCFLNLFIGRENHFLFKITRFLCTLHC